MLKFDESSLTVIDDVLHRPAPEMNIVAAKPEVILMRLQKKMETKYLRLHGLLVTSGLPASAYTDYRHPANFGRHIRGVWLSIFRLCIISILVLRSTGI